MAKGKNAAALFEVIKKSKQPSAGANALGGFSAPGWWFRRARAVKSEVIVHAPAAPVQREVYVEPAPEPVRVIAPPPAPMPAAVPPATLAAAVASNAPPRPSLRSITPVRPAPASDDVPHAQPIALYLDPIRRLVSLRMTYTTAIITAFAIVATVLLAVAIGQHMSRGPTPVFSETTENLRRLPAHPDVLDLRGPAQRSPEREPGPAPHPEGLVSPPGFNEPHRSTLVTRDPKRSLGLNYVVAQSYADAKLASDACDFLNKNGVPCTIERELRGWPKSAYIVVGIDGFARPSSNEFKDYVAKIERLGEQFAPPVHGQKSYKAFQPNGYKWDKAG